VLQLRYGINPQLAARAVAIDDSAPPIHILSGCPSYINLLDALNAWQLVREAGSCLGRPVATSFKHVSPAGAAASGGIDAVMGEIWDVDASGLSAAASAYIRARDCDPKSSFGDFVGVSVPGGPAACSRPGLGSLRRGRRSWVRAGRYGRAQQEEGRLVHRYRSRPELRTARVSNCRAPSDDISLCRV
jgi:hypothetical protein